MKRIYFIALSILSLLFIQESYSHSTRPDNDSELTEVNTSRLVRIWYDGSTRTLQVRANYSGREEELHVQVANSRGQFVAEETFILDRENAEFQVDLGGINSGTYRARAFTTNDYGFTKFSIR